MKVFLVAFVVLLTTLCDMRCSAQLTAVDRQLSREEKQLALEVHNFLRASQQAANMRQLEWDEELAIKAQAHAEGCVFKSNVDVTRSNGFRTGENLFFIPDSMAATTPRRAIEEAVLTWYNEGPSGQSYVQLLWASTHLMGCGSFHCPLLVLPDQSRTSATYIVCNYDPSFIVDVETYEPGVCSASSCPSSATVCVDFTSSSSLATVFEVGTIPAGQLCAASDIAPMVPDDTTPPTTTTRSVYFTSPRFGSFGGGTRVTIFGHGFSANQFAGSNLVTFMSSDGRYRMPCDVISYMSSTTRIICDTRPTPALGYSVFNMEITSDDGSGPQEVTTCGNNCRFIYHNNLTPTIEMIDPLASTPGELVELSGRLLTSAFSDDDPDQVDYFTRILVGGMKCDFMDDNGVLYGAVLTSSTKGYVRCEPTTGNRIGSMNTTAILAIRGNTFISFARNLIGLDNKFQPYTFQTHADILNVSPAYGSTRGGTQISITLNMPIDDYSDSIKVLVGGVPCRDVTLEGNSTVTCITGVQPPTSTYYPGGRGLLREIVTTSRWYDLDDVEGRPRSEDTLPQERAYRDNSSPREFGERNSFAQRYSGFFVPPLTSLYTFAVISDDDSRLYLSPNMSEDHKQRIAYADRHTSRSWDLFPTQTAAPILLEAGRAYYMEAISTQHGGPWYLGISAKIHNLSMNTYPFNGDNEVQMINISSTVVKEEHEITTSALPAVRKIVMNGLGDVDSMIICELSLNISDEVWSLMPEFPADYVAETLNSLQSIQRIGRVVVEKEDDRDETGVITFTIIFLTEFGTTESDIPDMTVSSLSCGNDSQTVAIEVIQELTIPESFKVGFDDGFSRYTSYLPLDVSQEEMETEISNLFAPQCETTLVQDSVVFTANYEDSSESERDNTTSFCGHYSAKNPQTIWQAEADPNIEVSKNGFLCFAYQGQGNIPSLRAQTKYFTAPKFEQIDENIDLSMCSDWSKVQGFTSWQHVCINLQSCFSSVAAGLSHEVSRIQFDFTGTSFWIDNFTISSAPVSIMQVAPPASPGPVSVNYVDVSGGLLEQPELHNSSMKERDSSGSGSNNQAGFDPNYIMIWGKYQVVYTVHGCGYGMSLLQGFYQVDSESPQVDIQRTAAGSLPVSGTFGLSFGNQRIRDIPFDVSADTLRILLENNFVDEGGFEVTSSGACDGYKWEVAWETKGGDQPPMQANGEGLKGSEPQVNIERVIDGGVWLRPIRGDMLRLPEYEPQVEVIINDIPSSCRGQNCAFNFLDEATPNVYSIEPYEGQGGTEITISGTNFSTTVGEITVTIGSAACTVLSANESHITCTAGEHSAGWYKLSVHIQGVGYVSINESLCFRYLLIVDSVSPQAISIGGGDRLVISGNGFIDFVPFSVGEPYSTFPWFEFGIGLPDLPLDNLCPFLEVSFDFRSFANESAQTLDLTSLPMDSMNGTNSEQFNESGSSSFDINRSFGIVRFQSLLGALYSMLPASVEIGGAPCIVVSANRTQIECVTTAIYQHDRTNLSVAVLTERVTLEDALVFSLNETAVIHMVDPLVAPTFGGTLITIYGSNLLPESSEASSVKVVIGDEECTIQSVNDTHIQCLTSPHKPGLVSILISTANGIAIFEPASTLQLQNQPNSDGFLGNDISGNDISGDGDSGDGEIIVPPFQFFDYQLEIFGIQPLTGSVLGGTAVTISGLGFSSEHTVVYIGNRLTTLLNVDATVIECDVPTSSQTHTVKFENRGFTTNGYDLAWSTRDLTIEVGDLVQWEWSISLIGVELRLFQTASNSSNDQLEGGFQSESDSSGSYSYTFTQPGTYHYITELTSTLSQGEIIRGTVYVMDLTSSVAGIQVFVAGFEALYSIAGAGGDSVPPLAKRSTHQANPICSDPEQASNEPDLSQLSPQQPPVYAYSVCHTPTVTSVTPRDVTLATVITISGVGFSQTEAQNIVKFGEHICNVVNSSESQIQCLLDGSSLPLAFVELELSLNVIGLGNAHVQRPAEVTITVRPTITGISPMQGSIRGGTDITILGTAFPSDGLQVWIGSYACEIKSNSYNQICCTSADANSNLEPNITVFQDDSSKSALCNPTGGCIFQYSQAHTPIVSGVSPSTLRGPGTIILTIFGTGFSDTPSENEVYVGQRACGAVDSNSTHVTCELDPLPAGSYELSLRICARVSNCSQCQGNASSNQMLTSESEVHSVVPLTGSISGGTEITISGIGFHEDTQVSIGGNPCFVSLTNYTTITCKTSPNQPGMYTIRITSGGILFPQTVSFGYAQSSTPQVDEVSPPTGQQGQEVTISGSGFSSIPEDNSVMIGGSKCEAYASNETTIECMLGANFVGDHNLEVSVSGMGDAMGNVNFFYSLEVVSISPTEGSLAGLNTMTVNGMGFNPNQISIMVCGLPCQLSTNPSTLKEVECVVPPLSDMELEENGNVVCDVIIDSLGEIESIENGYTFQENLTPVVYSINRTRGGTQGGSRIRIEGEGFTDTLAANVTIAGTECEVLEKGDQYIVCDTGASGQSIRAQVLVYIQGKGFAMSRGITFWYVDLWSSTFTWGGGPLPREGDFVIIPRGQTLVLDMKTPVLAYLLIQGGELIFDDEQGDNEVELHTEGVLIVDGGKLQVGTEENPFQHKTQIVLYGNVLSTEIPVYGAKTLAVRQGVLDLHGRPLNTTWTKLRRTAYPSDTTLYLQDSVDWEVGGKIVIASTSFSQRENEELTITAIDETGTVLSISPPLEYEHISIQQVIEGRRIDTSAEVGYLTRNVVVRGNINSDTVRQVQSCDAEFRPGQFEVQTCFLGRFGAETVDDQFGSQIMIHAAEQNKGDVIGRLEYIEVTHAGQAFRLGRYPIHYHLNGNVSGSYVRGCGIHHTFNRAVTIHAVDYLLVEKNVAYNILGHAYFLEDGIEQHNIIQDNLGIFVRASSSLLNVDITPATFWIVNPNNIVRRNAAAGGTHFGFWYRLPQNPTGPSATSSVCPRNLPLEEFSNNTAHSFGWYGLWVFPVYTPRAGGGCNDNQHTPVVFENFLAWRNDRGVEYGDLAGSLQLTGSILMDNKLAGFEIVELQAVWGENGPLIADSLIVGHSDISSNDSVCTESGIKTPHSYFLTVSGVTFVNFDRPGCFPIQACSQCKPLQGGFETRYERIGFVNSNSSQLTKWQWQHEHVHRDLDGTLTGTQRPSLLIPSNDLLPPESCQHHPASGFGSVSGSICDGTLEFGRFALVDPLPSSLEFTNANLSNELGTVVLEYAPKRLLGTGPGYMSVVQLNQTYHLVWPDGQQFTNFSYSELFSGFLLDDYIILSQTFPRSLDMITVGGVTSAANATALDNPATAQIGDWYINENNTIFYIIKGRSNEPENIPVAFSTSRCFYEDCVPPPPPTLPPPIPPGRPNVTYNWSDVRIWPGEQLPQAGEDVYVNCSMYILVNTRVPRLGTVTVCGGLEFLDTMSHVFEVDLIIIQGGRLVAGYPETPFVNALRFVLHGNLSSPELHFARGPTLGAKAIGVFGELILHSRPRAHTWTKLNATATAGGNQITVTDSVDWLPDEEIVVTSTSFEARQTEVFKILSVSPTGIRITLNASLQYTHTGESQTVGSHSYSIQAEVGLLTRNIVIESGDPALTDDEAFGCRVLVSNFIDDESSQHYVGSAQIGGVEFRYCGQLGYTDSFDPRFALAFLNRGPISDYSTYVQNSSFHDGYNTAIGVFGTSGILLENNVIHSTVGTSVWVTGSHHIVNRNLASLAIFIGTYRNRNEIENTLWTANFELTEAVNLTLTGNVASGGAKAGFHTNGEECTTDSDNPQIADNVAHSTLHGIHLGYQDGHASGCSKFSRFTLFSCYHYGIFSYGVAGIWVTEATLVNNFAGIYASVIGPASLSHILGNKEVRIENSLIVSASGEFNCTQDDVVPIISEHPRSHRGLRSRTGGHVGIVIPSFVSGSGHFPLAPWFTIISYPTINGSTTVRNVSFANFKQRCDSSQDVVLMTNPQSEDCVHPVHLKQIHFTDVSPESKLYNHEPRLGSVNPSDCVDMDCDGLKHALIRDEDGSFSELSGPRTFISMAEFEWGGDPRRGIGDYRIPRTMLTYANGSSIDVNQIYPEKGIVRGNGFGDGSQCTFNDTWNMYHCAQLDHLMLILESLDADTEVRRLSPIGIGANGFIDLLNGPQDHGWCGGYTCQERISTFYGIVASNFSYTIGLTSTNPQNFALHLLHSNEFQAIVVGIIYTNPQRLDVLYDDEYVVPNNAEQGSDGNLMYLQGSSGEFTPLVSSSAGSNFYDRDLKRLYITVRGKLPYKIQTTPVIQVSLTLEVTVDEFFGERLVQNLAFLLGIDKSRIRIVNVVRETVRRKRQTDTSSPSATFDIEIGNPPPITSNETTVVTNTTANDTTQEPQNVTTVLTFEMLEEVATTVVEVIQTGELTQELNATVVSATIMEPEPPQEDPTNGVRATNTTGGLQPGDVGNDTSILTFYDQQVMMEMEEQNETAPIAFSIPTRLVVSQQPGGAVVEGLVFSRPPSVQMYDNNNRPIQNLGLRVPWVLTATIRSGPEGAFLAEASANFVNGIADFTNLTVSHHGRYSIAFAVTYPPNADFSVASELFDVDRRQLELRVSTQPSNGNTTFRLYPYPAVELVDSLTKELVTEHTWRNRRWYITADVQHHITFDSLRSWNVPLMNGEARFTDILVQVAGTYRILFTAVTEPITLQEELPQQVSSNTFTVSALPVTRINVTYDEDFSTVLGNSDSTIESFVMRFQEIFYSTYSSIEIFNITVTEGSIIVSFFATTQQTDDLIAFVDQVTSNFQALSFTFNGNVLVPLNITQDPAYPIVFPTLLPATENQLVLILATTIPSGTILFTAILLIIVVILCQRHKRKNKVFKMHLSPTIANPAFEERYVQRKTDQHAVEDVESMDEFFLVPDHKLQDLEAQPFEGYEMADLQSNEPEKEIIVSQEVKVRGTTTFVNPYAVGNKVGQLDLDNSLDEIWNRSTNGNSNQNNNSNNGKANTDYDNQAFVHLPNVVVHPKEESECLSSRMSDPSSSAQSSKTPAAMNAEDAV